MDRGTFQSWLDAYGRAWMERDPQAAAALYAGHGTYQVTPFQEPLRGRGAILEYWNEVTRTEEGIQFDYEILAVTTDHGIARWWASFVRVPPGLPTKLDAEQVGVVPWQGAWIVALCQKMPIPGLVQRANRGWNRRRAGSHVPSVKYFA